MKNLKLCAYQYLLEKKRQWPAIADAAGVKHRWIIRFMDGWIADPGVSKIQKILDYAESQGWTYQQETNA